MTAGDRPDGIAPTDLTRPRSRPAAAAPVILRAAGPSDIPECGRILYEAFATLAAEHGFPPDFPSVEVATGCMRGLITQPGLPWRGRRTRRPDRREHLPRRTLDDLGDRAGQRRPGRTGRQGRTGARGGDARAGRRAARSGRPARPDQLSQPVAEPLREARVRCPRDVRRDVRRAGGGSRSRATRSARRPRPTRPPATRCASTSMATTAPASSARRSTTARHASSSTSGGSPGYTTGIGYFGHTSPRPTTTSGRSSRGRGAGPAGHPGPARDGELFRWCLGHGLRVFFVMNLMSIGIYQEPRGAYLASVGY